MYNELILRGKYIYIYIFVNELILRGKYIQYYVRRRPIKLRPPLPRALNQVDTKAQERMNSQSTRRDQKARQ